MNLLKSESLASSATRSWTMALSITTVLAAAVGGGEGDFFEQLLEHRVEPAGADVLDAGIDLRRQVGECSDRFVGEV